jgi:rubrerythrin
MNFRDVALSKEGDGLGHYQKCRSEAGVQGLSSIFEMFSADELRHAEALRALQNGAMVELPRSATLDGAKSILRRLSVQQAELSQFNGDLRCYLSAMNFESSTARACGQLARESDRGWEKELLLNIAAEDEMHFTLLEQMCELLEADRADDGVSDAH